MSRARLSFASPITSVEEFRTASSAEASDFMKHLLAGRHQEVDDEIVQYLGAALQHHAPQVVHDATIAVRQLHASHRRGMTPARIGKLGRDSMGSISHITQAFGVNMIHHEIVADHPLSREQVRETVMLGAQHVLNWTNTQVDAATKAQAVVQDTVLMRALSFLTVSALQKGYIDQNEADEIVRLMQTKTAQFTETHPLRQIANDFLQARKEEDPRNAGFVEREPALIHPATDAAGPLIASAPEEAQSVRPA